jgi:carnitine-CoA ligase
VNPSRYFTGIHDPNRWILPAVLNEQAERFPQLDWIISVAGDRMTFGQAQTDMQKAAGYFAGLGVRSGDRVLVMMENSCDFIRVWLGLTSMGAIAVPINTALTGQFLLHQLTQADAELIIIDADLAITVDAITKGNGPLRRMMAVGNVPSPLSGRLEHIEWGLYGSAVPYSGIMPRAHDTACIMFTSGTDGPSKAVTMPHAHCTLFGIGFVEMTQLDDEDRIYITLPLFHVNALLIQLGASLLAGVAVILRGRFSASAWLEDIRLHRATMTSLIGTMAPFLSTQPETRNDRSHSLRIVINAPNAPQMYEMFRERFGVPDVLSGYGMTEINIPVWGRVGRPAPGAAGWVDRLRFEVIVADPETDRELPYGTFGEILIRPKIAWAFMTGYRGMPERTVEAWRNLWFHTGDGGTITSDGLLTFVDRIKDCIRRRGENISVSEIEDALANMANVAEIAAYAVPSELPGGEDEVSLALVLRQGTTVNLQELLTAIRQLLPKFMHPQYIRFMDVLPKTSTGKVQRAILKRMGTDGAVDARTVS